MKNFIKIASIIAIASLSANLFAQAEKSYRVSDETLVCKGSPGPCGVIHMTKEEYEKALSENEKKNFVNENLLNNYYMRITPYGAKGKIKEALIVKSIHYTYITNTTEKEIHVLVRFSLLCGAMDIYFERHIWINPYGKYDDYTTTFGTFMAEKVGYYPLTGSTDLSIDVEGGTSGRDVVVIE